MVVKRVIVDGLVPRPGDLVLYHDQHRNLKERFCGIYLSWRTTKWSESHRFHRILEVDGGTDEFILRVGEEGKIKIVQRYGG